MSRDKSEKFLGERKATPEGAFKNFSLPLMSSTAVRSSGPALAASESTAALARAALSTKLAVY
jgi:hypothetical protein